MSLATITHGAVAVLAGLLVWFFQEARLGADLADERLQAGQYREQVTTERSAADKRKAEDAGEPERSETKRPDAAGKVGHPYRRRLINKGERQ